MQAERDSLLVLLVEDDPDARAMYAWYLRHSGMDVAEAAEGHKALQLAREQTPDVVVTDVRMPGVDGFELCRQLHEDPERKETPVVCLTADPPATVTRKAKEAGAEAVLTKPCLPDRLEQVVRDLYEKCRATIERARATAEQCRATLDQSQQLLAQARETRERSQLMRREAAGDVVNAEGDPAEPTASRVPAARRSR